MSSPPTGQQQEHQLQLQHQHQHQHQHQDQHQLPAERPSPKGEREAAAAAAGVGGSGMAKGDCMECRITGTVTCYVAAAYALTQRAAVAQPANRRFLAAFAAVWAALGTARAVI